MTATDAHLSAAHEEHAQQSIVVRTIDRLSDAAGLIAVLTLLTMTGIVCYEVTVRSLFNAPTVWVTEYSTYLFVALVFLGLAAAQKGNAHIQVEILLSQLDTNRRRHFEIVANWIGLFFVTLTTWQMASFVTSEYINGTRNWGLLSTPQWIPETPVVIGYVLFIAAILRDIYHAHPPRSVLERWLLPVAFAVATLLLFFLGRNPPLIGGSHLDWGSVVIAAALLISMVAWSGPRIAGAAAAILAIFALLFYLAADWNLAAQGVLLTCGLLFLLLIGVRVGIAMGVVGLFGLYTMMNLPQLTMLADRSWTSINSFTLTAVPAFVFMGSLLVMSGVTTKLFDTLVYWFGRTPGGLAHATVGASAVFAAVSGSSLATAATLGSVTAPEMMQRGYSPRLTFGVVASGSTLGILIPPSIAMIIYGNVVGAPITVLFIAGVIPGLLLAAMFMSTVFIWSLVRPEAVPSGEAYPLGLKIRSLVGILPFLFLIAAVLGSLYAGIATPTEAGAIGAAAALVLCLVRGKLTIASLYQCSLDTVRVTSFIMLIVVGAAIFSWVFDFIRVPRAMVGYVSNADIAPWVIMLMIACVYLALGTIIESISMMLMTLSVTFPIVAGLGYDPIWFGICLVLLIEIGLITPPVGIVLFILRGMSGDVALREIVLGVLPFIGVMLGFLVLLFFFPEIALWLPAQME